MLKGPFGTKNVIFSRDHLGDGNLKYTPEAY